jgi:polysaccharide export outer membrane protein
MKHLTPLILLTLILASACTSQQKLAYLSNLPETGGEEFFTMDIPDYKIQPRDILYITVKAMTPSGSIVDLLSSGLSSAGGTSSIYESSQYLFGFDINSEGNITIPVVGQLKVSGLTMEEIKILLQNETSKVFKNATVECKLLSFKFTVIGEVRAPGAYINYNNYLTVLEAIGRAGGVGDYGRRDKVLVVRPTKKGTKTYNLNLQDKNLLASEAYFLLPNDVVIVEPVIQKIFNMNLPTISFIISTFTGVLTTTLLLINYFGN